VSSITQKLTQKQQRFVDEYIISGNATQAAIKAGYSKRSAQQTGAENLLKPVIKAELDKRNAEIQSKKTMDMQEVMERLASFGRGEVTEEQVTNSGEIVQVKTKNSDQIRALELIGKRYGAWTDKKEVSGSLEIDVGVGEYDEDD
jgi:phage terminase small subunit